MKLCRFGLTLKRVCWALMDDSKQKHNEFKTSHVSLLCLVEICSIVCWNHKKATLSIFAVLTRSISNFGVVNARSVLLVGSLTPYRNKWCIIAITLVVSLCLHANNARQRQNNATQSTFNSFCRVLYFFSMCEMLGIKVKQAWWADIFTLPQRNRTFVGNQTTVRLRMYSHRPCLVAVIKF